MLLEAYYLYVNGSSANATFLERLASSSRGVSFCCFNILNQTISSAMKVFDIRRAIDLGSMIMDSFLVRN
jgi:hypothetical protein